MKLPQFIDTLKALQRRALPQGGFAARPGDQYRPDSTAWAILILANRDPDSVLLNPARDRLTRDQLKDGRICISPDHSEAIWPTPLAVLAWTGSSKHRSSIMPAIRFLLSTTGTHWEKKENTVIGHDPSIQGWPWIANTHSWVQPTALAMLALSTNGHGNHERVQEGKRMLLDRQLPKGGWNYGNTTVLGQELNPFPEATGAALNALAGLVPQPVVHRSIEYLAAELPSLRTPLSLGWGILGLKAWGACPPEAEIWIMETLARESKYGSYDTPSLCILLAAQTANGGLESILVEQPHFVKATA